VGTRVVRIRVEHLNFPQNVVAGCNYLVIASLTYLMRGSNEDPPPVPVRDEGGGRYSISDGRHRVIAAIIAGRPDVLCEIEETP